ncbi:aspartyl aminopeptidase [Ramicandelaber brevisporus]|nr:aspartyl aminopeptidase [Ramicandelaber brevisporus]
MSQNCQAASEAAALRLMSFLDASPTPFHAVASSRAILEAAGFTELQERSSWWSNGAIRPGGRYYLTRNGSSIVAFAVGRKFRPGNGAIIVGAHTDSPSLKLKPVSNKSSAGFAQVGVQVYDGATWPTWFDRDLGVAGRVVVELPASSSGDPHIVSKLVKVDKPVMRIPTLAIHLRSDPDTTLNINKETQLQPILGTIEKLANLPSTKQQQQQQQQQQQSSDFGVDKAAWIPKDAHHPALLALVAKEAGVTVDQLRDFELHLFDTQKATIGGLADEFVHSARLDNLLSSFCAIEAIASPAASSDESLADEECIRMVVLFDNEEIGSRSAQGAQSPLLNTTLERIQYALASQMLHRDDISPTLLAESMTRSWLISSDVAHSVHPNYTGSYEADHRPILNGGVVIKINANVKYATTSETSTMLKTIARKRGIPLQQFVIRNDSPGGSTIGPIVAARLGIRTIDVGAPVLAMHSIREMTGVDDVKFATDLYIACLTDYTTTEQSFQLY